MNLKDDITKFLITKLKQQASHCKIWNIFLFSFVFYTKNRNKRFTNTKELIKQKSIIILKKQTIKFNIQVITSLK